jgi:hypothetical protein
MVKHFIAIIILAVSLSALTQAATYGGGTGTADDPYQIWTPQQMNTIGVNPADWDKSFKLMADIDMSIYTGTQYNIIGTDGDHSFSGAFDGNGHIISNLTYTTTDIVDCVGLFGYSDAVIQNLGLENVLLSSNGNCIGGLVGCSSRGSITTCYATGSICGSGNVGGLVGQKFSGSITACYAAASVSGDINVGGLLGDNDSYATLIACYATGLVSDTGSVGRARTVGGLVGFNIQTITCCFWDIQTSGQSGSSGGKGLTTEQMKTMSIFQNAGWKDMGWVLNEGVDYPRLSWENTGSMPIPSPQAIPLAGSGTTENPYLVSTIEDFAFLSWHCGILDKQIKLTTNLDLSGITIYPIGDLGPFIGVFDGNKYTISNVVINQPGSDCVGLFGFIGTGGQIKNLELENINITGDDSVGGLVGQNCGTLTDCCATGSVVGSVNIGGLAGSSSKGILTSCHAAGLISGDTFVGGLVGQNGGTATLITCYATASAGGTSCVGGLVGVNSGILTSCYATGSASGKSRVGGLVGWHWVGEVTACYAIGSVYGNSNVGGLVGRKDTGSITACFWDIQTSNMTDGVGSLNPDPNGVMGLDTTAMMKLSTFTSAGWDFDLNDGDAADWMMLREGEDYPRLVWQTIYPGDISGLYGVDMADLMQVVNNWLEQGCPSGCQQADIDNSGTVDLADLSILAANWLKQ